MDFWTILAFVNIIAALVLGILCIKKKDWLALSVCAIVLIGQPLSMIF